MLKNKRPIRRHKWLILTHLKSDVPRIRRERSKSGNGSIQRITNVSSNKISSLHKSILNFINEGEGGELRRLKAKEEGIRVTGFIKVR